MEVHELEKLEIWCKARELAVDVYREVVPSLPKEEQWGLASQLRRASVSVAANIAEGHGRYYFQERIRSCYLARGSLEEVETLLMLAQDLGYLKGQHAAVVGKVHALRRMLNSSPPRPLQPLMRKISAGSRRASETPITRAAPQNAAAPINTPPRACAATPQF